MRRSSAIGIQNSTALCYSDVALAHSPPHVSTFTLWLALPAIHRLSLRDLVIAGFDDVPGALFPGLAGLTALTRLAVTRQEPLCDAEQLRLLLDPWCVTRMCCVFVYSISCNGRAM